MLIVDTTVVTVALPDMAKSLDASLPHLQWVMNIYTLALAVMTLSAGSLGDLLGQRRVFGASIVIFSVASLVSGLAPNSGILIAARGVQGVGGAAMIGTTLALLGASYSGKDRGKAFGTWGAVLGIAAATGPMLGGVLTQYLSWRAIFYINLPIGVLTLILAVLFVPDSPRREGAKIDIPGMLSFAVFAGALTYGLIRAGEDGNWSSGLVLSMLAVSVVALIVFVAVELRHEHPMLDVRLFKRGSFSVIMLCVVATSVTFAGLVYTSIWLQDVLGLGALGAGAALLPMALATFVASKFIGKRLHAVPPRISIGVGLLLIAVGCALIGVLVGGGSSWYTLAPGLILIGAGIGISGPGTNAAVLAAVPSDRGGMASGAMATFRQLGQALGVAVLGLIYQAEVESQGVGVREAAASGLDQVYLVEAGLGLLGCLLALVLVRGGAASVHPVPQPESAEARS
jgi:EmrB/QacA subfamily drug resistance transporter